MTTPDLSLPMGIYRHYKGPLYQVLGLAHDANADTMMIDAVRCLGERIVVVYIGLQLTSAHDGPRLAVRTLEDFTARLHIINGDVCKDPAHDPDTFERFKFLGPTYEHWMIT